MGDRDDELLQDVSDAHEISGGFGGYRAGLRTRRLLYGSVIAVVLTAVGVGIWYARKMERLYRTPLPQRYELAEPREQASAERPRELVWASGRARLGLSRTDPGVTTLVLPDRLVTLAKGCDHAQVKVEVRDGVTVSLDVLVGEVIQTRRPDQAPPAGPAANPSAP